LQKEKAPEVDITPFIRELLFGHDCVIIPGFGGFICNYTPARTDKNSGTFYPPVKQVSFNRNLNHNDGLLIGQISGSLKLGYGDARNIVDEFVGSLRRKLEKGEKINFDNIGVFVNNQEGNIQFEPDRSANYHLDSFGLEPFQWLPLEGYDVRKRILGNIEKAPLERQISWKKILWRAAVIVPLISIMVIVPLKTNLFKAKIESTTMNPLPAAGTGNIKPDAGAVTKEMPENAVNKEITVTGTVPENETAVPAAIEPSEVYYLITGSFKSEKNAALQADILKTEGYTPEILTANNGFFRVSAMKCNDMNSALAGKATFLKKFPGTWISKTR
jgi:nucleoid DNA-binding protein